MSDSTPPPPRPKPGSLRDRIAAFENHSSQPSGPVPPPPRPKPAGLQWKPRQPSPPGNDHGTSPNTSPGAATVTSPGEKPRSSLGSPGVGGTSNSGAGAGMSASDARESIRQGASLKERMAALQGKGAFGGFPAGGATGSQGNQPPPVAQKPKWKPPPQVPVVPAEGDREEKKTDEEGEEGEEQDKEKDAEGSVAAAEKDRRDSGEAGEAEEESGEAMATNTEEGDQAVVDPEEEERQRRAAIAARMARLGGARVGMAPPGLFGGARPPPPPVSKKPELRKEPAPVHVPAPASAPVEEEEKDTESPAAALSPPHVPESSETTEKVESASIGTSSPTAQSRSPPSMPVPAVPRRTAPPRRKPPKSPVPPPPEAEPEALAEVEAAAAEAQERQEILKDAEPLTTEERREVEVPPVEELETTEEFIKETEIAEAQEGRTETVPVEVGQPELGETVVAEELVEEPEMQETGEEKEQSQIQEEAEDEEARRKRIAERLAKMGGVNPLFAAPPVPKRTMSKSDEGEPVVVTSPGLGPGKRRSVDSVSSGGFGRRTSVGSVKEVEYRLSKSIVREAPKLGEGDELEEEERNKEEHAYKEEEEEENTDALAASIIMERPHEAMEEESDTVPVPPPRRSSGFIIRSSADEAVTAEQGRVSPPPLPVSPRISSILPRHASHDSHPAWEEESQQDTRPIPVPHRAPSLRSDHFSFGTKEVVEDEEDDEGDELQEDIAEGEYMEEEEEMEEVKHIPLPPTRQAPLPPPGPGLEDEEEDYDGQHSHDSVPVPGSAQSDEPLVIPPPTVGRRMSRQHDPLGDTPLPHPMLVRPSQVPSARVQRMEREVMDDEEGDPIDPSFHTPKRAQSAPSGVLGQPEPQDEEQSNDEEKGKSLEADASVSGMEAAKRRTIAERMARLGGLKFGEAPIPIRRQASMALESGEDVKEKTNEDDRGDEEGEERARKERITAKLAGMGGMRIGMMPSMMGIPQRPPQRPQGSSALPPVPTSPVAATTRPAPPPVSASSHDAEWEHGSTTTSEEGVKVELEESELEEVHHEDAGLDDENEDGEIVSPLNPPPRAQRQPPLSPTGKMRPPVPSTMSIRRSSVGSIGRKVSSGSATTTGSHHPARRQSDYVMVEEPQEYEPTEAPPPPARPSPRVTPPSHHPPPPPPPSAVDNISSQWELPSIPSASLGMTTAGNFGTDLSIGWVEAGEGLSTASASGTRSLLPLSHAPPPPSPGAPVATTQGFPTEQNLSSDDLMAVWGRVGVQVCEVATAMYEKSKKTVVGDGTYAGFVRAALNEVPNAIKPAHATSAESPWGYPVYSQTGSAVLRRTSEIMPGDVIELIDARFKGHKGLQPYTQHVGVGGHPLVGILSEFEPKKSKAKVLQANQHVGQQTVELVSYKLEDLKSGTFKAYRVLEAQ